MSRRVDKRQNGGMIVMIKREEEKHLIGQARQGDMEAKNEIVKRYQWLVKKMVYRMSGTNDEDLIATAYRGILLAIDKFDESVGCAFGTFAEYKIRGVISNEFTNRQRNKRILNETTISLQTPVMYDDEGDNDTLQDTIAIDNGEEHGFADIFKDETNCIMKAVKKLTKSQQTLFEMKYITGMSDDEIVRQLGCSLGKVQYQVRKLRRDLNDVMGLDYEIPGIKSSRKCKRDRSHLRQDFKISI